MMLKYASATILSAEFGGKSLTLRTAHRATFSYIRRPGYLYVRTRAISSRCNDNFDDFGAEDIRGDGIRTGYRTFIGKPAFVNHVNDNHRRARGVIVDAALHEDVNLDGTPDVWVELLHEVDAAKFPMLTEAILNGEITTTSMGCDVEYSVCSFCGNRASTPLEYCAHIPRLKGKRIRRVAASGKSEDVLVREICHGLRFFENSFLVEDPADPTAFVLDIDDSQLSKAAAKGLDISAGDESAPLYEHTAEGWVTGRLEIEDVPMGYRRYAVGDYDVDLGTVEPIPPKTATGDTAFISASKDYTTPSGGSFANQARWKIHWNTSPDPKDWGGPVHVPGEDWDHEKATAAVEGAGVKVTHPWEWLPTSGIYRAKGTWDRKTAVRKLAYGEITAPPDVDTLREADCPVCGDSDFDGEQCKKCGFQKPPDQYMDPDLDKAKEVDLRGGEEDPTAVGDDIANAEVDDLVCDNCGTTFSSTGSDEEPGGIKKVKTIPELPKPEDTDEDAPPPDATPGLNEGKIEGDDAADIAGEKPNIPVEVGDRCPVCGKGTLVANDEAAMGDVAAGTAEGVFIPPEEEEEEPPTAKKAARRRSGVAMRPVLAAMAEQQRVIEDQAVQIRNQSMHIAVLEHQMGTLARLAGAEKPLIEAGRKAVAKLRTQASGVEHKCDKCKFSTRDTAAAQAHEKDNPGHQTHWRKAMKTQADVDNPAQPVPAPPSEGPAETTEQALNPAGRDDVTSIGESPVADVSPDAQTSVDAPQTVLDEPLDLNEEEVTAPVAGTEGPLPLDDVKIETDVRVGNPDDPNPAFPLEGPFAQRATTGAKGSQARAFASLHLARLRIATGIAPGDPEVDDLALGVEISESDMSPEVMDHEIETLSRIVQRAGVTQRQAPRQLVPRRASASGQRPPSLRSEAAVEIPVATMAPGVQDEEFGFE